MRPGRRLAAGLLLGLSLVAARAWAHQSSLAYAEVVLDGADVDLTLQIANTDLFEALGVERDRPVTRDEVLSGKERLFAYLAARLHVDERGAACPAQAGGMDLVDKLDGFFVAARLRF